MKASLNILIVDDNKALAATLKDILQEKGYGARMAFDGGSAISMCRETPFDLILLDFKLPDTDGLRLQERLAASTDADFVVITGHASLESAAEAVGRRRVVGYETKPLDMARLLAFIQQVDERRRAEKVAEQRGRETDALLEAARGVLQYSDLARAARRIFDICSELIGTDSGYVALLTEDGQDNDVLFLDSGGRECTVDPDLPMPVRGLREEAYRTCRTVYDNDFSSGQWVNFLPDGHMTLNNVMFAPLTLHGRTVGVMGMANKPLPFTDEDARLAAGFGEIASMALRNAKMLTSLENARESAEASARIKSEFLAHASHEIRSPMSAIIGGARILKDTPLKEEQRDYVETIANCSDILLALINDILDFSKIEAGKIELERAPFSPDAVIRAVIGIVAIKSREKQIDLRREADASVARWFLGDMNRIRQVLINLAGNAVKFTETGEVVIAFSLVSESDAGAMVRFSVRDTGIGIPPDRIASLFEPFSQADAAITRQYGGTGLGLTICKRIVEMMGGEIGVQSETGVGSAFSFTLPLEKAGERAAPAGEAETVRAADEEREGKAPPRILLAEDNVFNQKIMQLMLNHLGFQSDVAGTGREAVRMLVENRYDLVLMDIEMPDMNGVEATVAIRKSGEGFQDIPIVALTGHANPDDRERWLAAGMNDCLIKPAEPAKLRDVVYRRLDEAKGQAPS